MYNINNVQYKSKLLSSAISSVAMPVMLQIVIMFGEFLVYFLFSFSIS